MSKVETDSTYFGDKVELRIRHLPQKENVKVLDCFAGNGTIWKQVMSKRKGIQYVPIEKKNISDKVYLRGDNLKFLKGLDLNSFDVIDLDAYGVPYRQLKEVFQKTRECVIFVTFIQSFFGGLPYKMLEEIGYSQKMIRKIPTLFYKNGLEKFIQFLAQNGVRKIWIRSSERKNYIAFKLKM